MVSGGNFPKSRSTFDKSHHSMTPQKNIQPPSSKGLGRDRSVPGSCFVENGYLEDGLPGLDPVVFRITPIYKPWKGHLEGEQAYLGS